MTGLDFLGLAISMRRALLVLGAAFLLSSLAAGPAVSASLKGSEYSVQKQYQVARTLKLSPVRSTKDVQRFVDQGLLVPVPGNEDYELGAVSYPFARPATRAFLERLGREYRLATGERLVVTSLTRPMSRQPRNASSLSVHPMGIAADIRRPHTPKARAWLEQKLKTLEAQGIVEATHERRPPHFHVAVFPNKVETYAAIPAPSRDLAEALEPETVEPSPNSAVPAASGPKPAEPKPYTHYTVQRGDSLWTIAGRFGTSVRRLKNLNGMHSSRILPGQKLMVPQGAWE